MAKRLSENQKEKILIKFRDGYSIELLAKEFNCTKLTISRNLKKYISEHEFQSLNTQKIEKKKNFITNNDKLIDPQVKNYSNQELYGEKAADRAISNLNLKKDYPECHFLSENELERKTIEIHIELKDAKRSCNKEQKVIKVPNTKVFEIAAPILISRGISRIISDDKLIAL